MPSISTEMHGIQSLGVPNLQDRHGTPSLFGTGVINKTWNPVERFELNLYGPRVVMVLNVTTQLLHPARRSRPYPLIGFTGYNRQFLGTLWISTMMS